MRLLEGSHDRSYLARASSTEILTQVKFYYVTFKKEWWWKRGGSSHHMYYAKMSYLFLGQLPRCSWCLGLVWPICLGFLLRRELNGSYLSLACREDMEYLKGHAVFLRFPQPVTGTLKGVPYDQLLVGLSSPLVVIYFKNRLTSHRCQYLLFDRSRV